MEVTYLSEIVSIPETIIYSSNLLKEVFSNGNEEPFPIILPSREDEENEPIKFLSFFTGEIFSKLLSSTREKISNERDLILKFHLSEFLDCDYLSIDLCFDLKTCFYRKIDLISFIHLHFYESKTKRMIYDFLYLDDIIFDRIQYPGKCYPYIEEFAHKFYDGEELVEADSEHILRNIDFLLKKFTTSPEGMYLYYILSTTGNQLYVSGKVYSALGCKYSSFTDESVYLILQKLSEELYIPYLSPLVYSFEAKGIFQEKILLLQKEMTPNNKKKIKILKNKSKEFFDSGELNLDKINFLLK